MSSPLSHSPPLTRPAVQSSTCKSGVRRHPPSPAAGTLLSTPSNRIAFLSLSSAIANCLIILVASPFIPIRSGMDRPEKRSVAAQPALPDDPLVEILSRVSVKDLYRSKCVSKAWCKLITDPIHRKKLPQTLEGFFYGGDAKDYGCYINLMNRPVPPVDPSFSFLNKLLPDIENLRLLHSCNGLLLFEHGYNPDTSGYVVCNPATEQLVAVPLSPLNKDGNWFGDTTFLMSDPAVSSHFHLIKFWNSLELNVVAVHIFSSETGVWSDRASEWRAGEEGGQWAQWVKSAWVTRKFSGTKISSTFFNSMLHFVPCRFDGMVLIVGVDGGGKTCRIIPWQELYAYPIFIGHTQGRLCIIARNNMMTFDELSIWVLEDYDTEEWSLKQSVRVLKLFGKISDQHGANYDVVAIHPDRNLVFFVEHWNQKLISYDMDSKEVHALCTLEHTYEFITPYVPYFSELPVLVNKH
ncbi:hypothetical protein EJB05_14696, partial [Eragrostis curvula]